MINFQDLVHKNDFDIYDPFHNLNFSTKFSTEPVYMCGSLEY